MEKETLTFLSYLLQLLTLVESNMHTSASNPGLELKGRNNEKMEEILLKVLEMTKDEAEELYLKFEGICEICGKLVYENEGLTSCPKCNKECCEDCNPVQDAPCAECDPEGNQ